MPASPQVGPAVPCRCCPGGVSRSTRGRRYPSDMTDAEWAVIEPLLPAPGWKAGQGGCRAATGAAGLSSTGSATWCITGACGERCPPTCRTGTPYGAMCTTGTSPVPPCGCVTNCVSRVRVLAGRLRQPTAAIIYSQSVKASDTVGKDSRGYDAGKKIEDRKRHLAVDVLGLILAVAVTAASVQDRDGARPLLWKLAATGRTVTLIWADGGYAGRLVTWAVSTLAAPCRSSSAPITCTPSRFCPAAG